MAKDTFYFSHDYSARNDPKLVKVLMRLGQSGKGVYWDLIEMLYEEGGYLLLSEIEAYAFALRTDCETIKSLINDFGLFQKNDKEFWSESVLRRLDERDLKSKKASESAKSRWDKANANKIDANALPTQSDSNAIKESKGKEIKEIKGNDIKARKLAFSESLKPFLEKYGSEMLNDFYGYWTEPNKTKTKFRQELLKTWDVSRRLSTWNKNDFNKKNNGGKTLKPGGITTGKIQNGYGKL